MMFNSNVKVISFMYLLVSLVLLSVADQNGRTPISVTSGVYWREIKEVQMYESSVPLVYKSVWPGLDPAYVKRPEGQGFCNGTLNDPDCMLFQWIANVDKTLAVQVSWLNRSLGEINDHSNLFPGERQKRSLDFVGNFAHWCCGIVTSRQLKPLFTNQKNMNVFEQQLQVEMQEAYSEIDNVTSNMNLYSEEVSRTFTQVIDVGINVTKMIDRFKANVYSNSQREDQKIYSLLQMNAHQTIRQLQLMQLMTRLEILSQCREKKLPNSIVSLNKFRSDLIKLRESIREDGYDLVIPVEEVTMYLKLEISDCVISGSTIMVHLKIPIQRRSAQWKLFELISVPFAWKNSTCSIDHDVKFLAADRDRLMTIQGAAARDCRPYDNLMCFVPRYASEAASGSLCPKAMFAGATIQKLSDVCTFSCSFGMAPIVSRVEEEIYVLTHISGTLELICRYGNSKNFKVPTNKKPGALQIKVPCDCRLNLNNNTLVFENYPCTKKISVSDMVHIVPASWSKLKSLKLPPRNSHSPSTFETLEECLDENWPIMVPHWNYSSPATHREARPTPIVTAQEVDVASVLSIVFHTVYFALVTVVVIRNPHLLGLYIVHVSSAEPLELYVNEHTATEVLYYMITILCFVLGWMLVRWIRRTHRKRNKVGEVEMTARREAGDKSDLPRDLPVAEVDGRELRITLEWWDPTGTISESRHPSHSK